MEAISFDLLASTQILPAPNSPIDGRSLSLVYYTKGGRTGDAFLPDAPTIKLRVLWTYKARRREGLQPGDPLFCSQFRVPISKHRVQFAFRTWQVKAGFDRLYPFHALRHTAVTNV